MKRTLLSLIAGLGSVMSASAQCATTSTPFQNCSYYGDRIMAFSLNSIPSINNAGCASGGYSLYATPVRTLQMGNTYAWTCQTGANYANGMGIWIDWNNNGSWATNECVAFKNYAFNHSGTITVPYTAVVGVNIRMRVMCSEYYNFTANTNPCSSLNGYGETEDYSIYINCPTSLPTLTVASSNTYICLGQSATLTASGAQNYTWTGGSGPVTNGVGFAPLATAIYTVTGGISACPSVTNSASRTISVSSTPLNLTATGSSPQICNGTTATLQVSGANNYTWGPGTLPNSSVVVVSPNAGTTYTAIGYNGSGCPGVTTISVGVNPMPTITAVGTSSTVCAGKSVTLTANGALSYTWNPSIVSQSIVVSPTISTLYSVQGTNSFGCSGQTSTIVLATAAPPVNATASSTYICIGGSVTLNASGANTYSWTGGPATALYIVTPAANTSYTVTGTNTSNGCSGEKVVNINVFSPVVTVSSATSICNGATAHLTASGANGYTWNPGITGQNNPVTPASTTVYTLTANTITTGISTCKTTQTVLVTVNPNPTITAVASPSSICRFGTSTITASGANSYVWNTSESTPAIVSTPSVSGTQIFSVTGTSALGCSSGVQVFLSVSSCNSLKELNNQSPVSIFPNPNKGEFSIKYDRDLKLSLVNELGQLIMTIALNDANNHTVDVKELPAGIYFVVGQNDKGQIMQKIIVK